MKSNKEYRFNQNPQEKVLHDKFKAAFEINGNRTLTLSGIIFGWSNDKQTIPNEYLTDRESDICLNLIQWLGSPVGQNFLRECGFVLDLNSKK